MIGYFEGIKTLALNALFNPLLLGLLIILFLAGKFFGKLTRKLNIWKILIVGYFSIFLFPAVRDAGPYIGGIFLLGIASNHVGTLFSVLGWASSLGDMIFAFRYKSAYSDIRRREQELEERERKLKDAEMCQAYQQQEQRSRAGWQNEAKEFRKKPEDTKAKESSGNGQGSTSGSQGQKQRVKTDFTPPPQTDARARNLEILGLKSGRDYSPDEIKKAYRRKVMKVHPDAGGSQVEFITTVNAYVCLR